MMDDLRDGGPVESISHISISGPTLASLLHVASSSSSDAVGLLFGHLSSPPSSSLHDDHLSSSPSPLPSLTITSLLSSSSPHSSLPLISPHPSPPLGIFSARRCSPLRPSMRERFLLSHLPSKPQHQRFPSILLLLTSSPSPNLAVHTHGYRAFELRPGGTLEPRPVHVVNVGPAFRGHYGAFDPASRFPPLPCGGGRATPDGQESEMLDLIAEGFGAERLRNMVGAGPTAQAQDLEKLYGTMLERLGRLACLVEENSKKVDEQEYRNMKLRCKIACLD